MFAILKEDRELCNAALEDRIDRYRTTGEVPSAFDQMKCLTEITKDDPEWTSRHRRQQQEPLFMPDRAFRSFFRHRKQGKKPDFPKFRGKKFWKTNEIVEQYRIEDGRFHSEDFDTGVRSNMPRPIPEDARHCGATITLTKKGWYLCLKLELPTPDPKPVEEIEGFIGTDLSPTILVARSDRTLIDAPRFERKAHKRIRINSTFPTAKDRP